MNKIKLWCKIFVIIISINYFGCKETPMQPLPQETENIFPISEGNVFVYSIDSLLNNSSIKIGELKRNYLSIIYKNGTPYYRTIDSSNLNNKNIVDTILIRRSDYGVYSFFDTTGFTLQLPDSLKRLINLSQELILFSFPFEEGKYWNVFRFMFYTYTLINFNANYIGEENILIQLQSGSINSIAKKIKYEMIVYIPDYGFGFSAFTNQTAYAWLVKDIGLVKLEGQKGILSFFNNGIVDVSDTTTILRQSLISYKK